MVEGLTSCTPARDDAGVTTVREAAEAASKRTDAVLEIFYKAQYPLDYARLQELYPDLYPFGKVSGAKSWARDVLSLEVVLHRAGRAVIREPGADWTVELRWEAAPRQRISLRNFHIVGCQLMPDEDGTGALPFTELSVGKYITALYFELKREQLRGGGRIRQEIEPPQAGKPPSTTWYRALLEERQQLMRERHPSPTKELARRHRVPVGTMKSWLYRARGYVGGDT
jgi:hypothetical protein